MKYLILICFLLTGCGHSKVKPSVDTFFIEKSGRGFSSEGAVRKDFLKECAEKTIENGFDYFVVTKEDVSNGSQWVKPSRSGIVKAFKEGGQYLYNGNQIESLKARNLIL